MEQTPLIEYMFNTLQTPVSIVGLHFISNKCSNTTLFETEIPQKGWNYLYTHIKTWF